MLAQLACRLRSSELKVYHGAKHGDLGDHLVHIEPHVLHTASRPQQVSAPTESVAGFDQHYAHLVEL